MTQRLPRLKVAEVTHILHKNGFVLIDQRGSHQKWRHPSGRQVIVPFHQDKELPLGTLKSIFEGSGIAAENFHP